MSAVSGAPLEVSLDGPVATVELRRPPNNHVDASLLSALAAALEDLAADGTARAVVLCSEGRHFCGGASFGEGGFKLPEGFALYDVAIRLFEQPLPIVAAVQGAAVGGGLGLALAADFRVAAPEARFSANFARLGFHHGFGLTVTLPAAVGPQRALELLYTGRRINGEEAFQIGLCDRLVPLVELRSAAAELAREIAASAPLAVRSIRQTMRGGLAGQVRAALEREKAEQLKLIQTGDWEEGLRAMSERRTPSFKGR
ncbi:MAG: enoyl-CoA hydratase/isomerase family protein [Candidatus Dormibacteria bacterium]